MGSDRQNDAHRDDPTAVAGRDHRTIDRYRLLRLIGSGSMSSVYAGYDAAGLRPVAIKLLADHLAADKLFFNRFYREARLSVALDDLRIVRGYSFGYDPAADKHYLVMEYVDGPDAMAQLNEHGPLPVASAVRIGIAIGRALAALHAADLVHRDVKPDNILLGRDGSVKLADLGLAKRRTGDLELTTANQGVGTPHYMPYEQSANAEFVDGRSDLFALGATIYHLLTGRLPFPGETHEELVRQKACGEYVPAREYRPDLPPVLDLILTKALARDPRNRFADLGKWTAALIATRLHEREFEVRANGIVSAREAHPAARTRADLQMIPFERPIEIVGERPSKSGAPPAVLSPTPPAWHFGWPVILSAVVAAVLAFASLQAAFWPEAPHVEPCDTAGSPDGASPGETQ